MTARKIGDLLAAVVALTPTVAQAAPLRVVRTVVVETRSRLRLFPRFRPRILVPTVPRLHLRRPGLFVPPPAGGFRYEEGVPTEPYSLPHGFTLTVPMGPGPMPAAPNPLTRYAQVATALGACWHPPTPDDADWSDITLRVSFKRDGMINGLPRIPYVAAADAARRAAVENSLLGALRACTPLPFSPSLGAAIAGEIFAIRFTNRTPR